MHVILSPGMSRIQVSHSQATMLGIMGFAFCLLVLRFIWKMSPRLGKLVACLLTVAAVLVTTVELIAHLK